MKLRPAAPEDAGLLLAWRNDPVTRNMSFEQDEITLAEHERWLRSKLADSTCDIWIGEVDGVPVGQVRLDADGEADAVVSISVAPGARGRGLGRALLLAGLARRTTDGRLVRAHVLSANEASLRLFRSCGFAEVERHGDRVTLAHRPPVASRRPVG